ncbi:MAG: pentapeptide repeat-containing protein [Cyanobacteria bacterium P01_H01_bin.105]
MAQQIMKAQNSMVIVPKGRSVTLAWRRLLAWSLEVSLVAMGAVLPWAAGQYVLMAETSAIYPNEEISENRSVQDSFDSDRATLNPLVNYAQNGWAWIAQIPPYQLHRTVPKLTNIFWSVALMVPVAVAGGQLVQLWVTGRTWPKRWLGVQVISMTGQPLGLYQVVIREVVRWGIPLLVIGGGTLLTSVSFGVWTPLAIGLLALAQGGTVLTSTKRALHDRIAKTQVVMVSANYLPVSSETLLYSLPLNGAISPQDSGLQDSSAIRLYGEIADDEDEWWLTEADGNLTSLVLPPRSIQDGGSLVLPTHRSVGKVGWWLAVGVVLAGVVGFGVGRIFQAPVRRQAENDTFLRMAEALMTRTQAGGDYNAAILMLAQVDDPRTVQYLTDLLSQVSQPETLATIQQALVSQGLESLPPLLALSHVLEHDLQQTLDVDTRYVLLEQRHVVQGAIAKLLTVHSDELTGIRLDRVNLGRYQDTDRAFRLIQPGLLAAGTSWQGANLNQANLARASFFDKGADGKADSYDDIISDLSGVTLVAARLEHSNLQGAQLADANLRRADLRDANLAYGNLDRAQLTNARLMQVNAPQSRWQGSNLVGADLTQAIFNGADLSQARLNRIEAAHSSWRKATLTQSDWVEANLIGADFEQANLNGADFQGAQLDSVNFAQADLRQANLQDADLRQITLTSANLTGADLAGAIFDDGTSVTGSFITPNTQLSTANRFQGVNFSRVRNLDGRQLNYICAQGGLHPSCQKLLNVE